jgi:non-specific serine/threonine protein kinase/serine/threonine-protein kinase
MTRPPENPDEQPTQAVQPRAPDGTAIGSDDADTLPAGAAVGSYRILGLLGRGGMGQVYRAEQLQPVHRTVALKLMTGRRLDVHHRAHFEVERQLLARMQHPCIAQIFDAGTTTDGLPYFAMELVEGEALTAYCEQQRLSLAARIALLIQVCEGVQHAHHKGVIHRDLKPGNILVTEVDGRPLPKIIDFGIATATQRSRAEVDEPVAGTPDYMSPEQSRGALDIDARSDVYALGVLMYELIAGRRPPSSTGQGAAETGAHTTLRPPSALLLDGPPAAAGAIADSRRISVERLRLVLQKELDWVVLRALQRERDARYPTPLALADELRRWLAGQPLHSVPQTRRYIWGKFVHRHRVVLGAAAAVLLSLLAGTALLLLGLIEAREQRQVAEQRQAELERVSRFQSAMLEGIDIEAMGAAMRRLQREAITGGAAEATDLLADLDRIEARWSAPDVARQLVDSQLLSRALVAVDRDFADQPLLAAELLYSLAQVYMSIGLYPQAEVVSRQSAALRSAELGERHAQTIAANAMLAHSLNRQGRLEDAQVELERTLANAATLDPDSDPLVTLELTAALNAEDRGEREEALASLQRLRERLLRSRRADDPALTKTTNNLAISLARLGRFQQARPLLEELLPLRVAVLGPEHADTLSTMTNLAVIRAMDGELEQALTLQEQLVTINRRRLGDLHPITLNDINNLGSTLFRLKRYEAAQPLLEEGLRSRRKVLGPTHPQTLRSMNNLASLLNLTGNTPAAVKLQRETVEARQQSLGPDHPDSLGAALGLATMLRDAGELEPAALAVQDVLARRRTQLPANHPDLLNTLEVAASVALAQGRHAAAEALLRERHDELQRGKGRDDPATLAAALPLYTLLSDQGRDASEWIAELQALAALDPAGLDEPIREDREEAIGRLRVAGALEPKP